MSLSEQLSNIMGSLAAFVPEVWLFVGFVVVIISDLRWAKFTDNQRVQQWLYILALLILVLSGYTIWNQWNEQPNGFLFGQMLFLDGKAIFFKGLALLAAIVMLLHSWVMRRMWAGEYFSLVIGIVLGLFLLSMAVNLLMIYLSIELISITSYLLTAFDRTRKSAEGALKYVLFGAVASAVMLYGMSLLYGMTGTLNITDAAFTRQLTQTDTFASFVAILLAISGLLFKISAVPFHVWNPDVYESAPMPVVSFFSVAPKSVAFLVLIRLLSVVPNDFQLTLAVISLLTITVGNFSALWQTSAKRLLAYSSIAQAGFVLVGLVAFNQLGLLSAVFYLATYLFISMAAFLLIDILTPLSLNNEVQNFKGLGKVEPFLGILVVIVMMALVGFPLTAGFSAKLLIFSSLWEIYQNNHQNVLLVLFAFGLLNAAVSLFYYLKIPFLLFFREASETNSQSLNVTLPQRLLALALVIPIVILFFKADWLMNLIGTL